MDARRVLIPLFLLATVLVDLAVLWPNRTGGNVALIALAALAGSQLSLAACYLVFGRTYVLWRVAAVALVLGAWSLVAGWAGLADAPPAFAMGTIYLSIVGGHVCIVRLAGGRWSHTEDEVHADARPLRRHFQFTLGDVYAAVTLMCVAMGAAVTLDWRLPRDLLLPTIVWSIIMSLLTVGSLSAMAPKRLLAGFVAITLLPGLLLAALWPLAVTSALTTALLVLSLVVLRQSGWRLVWRGAGGRVRLGATQP